MSEQKGETKTKELLERDKVELKRRKAISRIVATTGVVATMSGDWIKPVMNTTILPAHGDTLSGVNCLLHGTTVIMSDGSVKTIETLSVGQLIRGVEIDGRDSSFGVITKHIKNHQREAYFIINGELRITHDHPVRVRRGEREKWVQVEELIVGDQIKSETGYTRIRSSRKIFDIAMTVYMETSSDQIIVRAGTNSYVVKSKYASDSANALIEKNEDLVLSN